MELPGIVFVAGRDVGDTDADCPHQEEDGPDVPETAGDDPPIFVEEADEEERAETASKGEPNLGRCIPSASSIPVGQLSTSFALLDEGVHQVRQGVPADDIRDDGQHEVVEEDGEHKEDQGHEGLPPLGDVVRCPGSGGRRQRDGGGVV